MAKNKRKSGGPGKLRIIAGHCRGRSIEIPDAEGLRPTGDRIRETLFSWLQGDIRESRCLDLFAGSGALGFEAASRGASSVLMIEKSAKVCEHLRRSAADLGFVLAGTIAMETDAGNACDIEIACGDALSGTLLESRRFDLVFIDPPFAHKLHSAAIEAITRADVLLPGAQIYLESSVHDPAPCVPAAWHQWRSKQAGDVLYSLYRIP